MSRRPPSAYPSYYTKVHQAVHDKDLRHLRGLLLNKFEVNPAYFGQVVYMSPLHVAAEVGASMPIVHALLDAGAEIDGRDWLGCTPFFIAAQSHNLDLMYVLLRYAEKHDATININAQNDMGFAPLHIAARDAIMPMMKLLLHMGARQDVEDHRGFRPKELAEDYYVLEMLN